jgi:hypothetical protein
VSYKSDKPCIVCNESSDGKVCYHHIKSRKSGGCDSDFNLLPLCLKHHNEIHQYGRNYFIKQYRLEDWMLNNNWYYLMGRWWHD